MNFHFEKLRSLLNIAMRPAPLVRTLHNRYDELVQCSELVLCKVNKLAPCYDELPDTIRKQKFYGLYFDQYSTAKMKLRMTVPQQ